VLDTRKERLAVVGWFLSEETSATAAAAPVDVVDSIHPDTLAALRMMRDASPRLAAKLKPAPPSNNSGMIWDDWSMPGAPAPEPVAAYPDTDVRYWKTIGTFDPEGYLTTLSLSGNRLRHLTKEQWSAPGLLQHVVTLVLSNTDLSVSDMVTSILPNCTSGGHLKHLHMSGNGWGGDGTKDLLSSINTDITTLIKHLTTLDLRYNDIGTVGAAALSEILQQDDCTWRALYLEGNQLKDEGITALLSTSAKLGPIAELYLGQNQIGPVGAESLAQALPGSLLQKLYLEGNQIGNDGALALTVVLEHADTAHRLEKLYADMNGIGKDESIRLGRSLNSATFIGEGGLFQD
jgi:Ran GTPase-activating protein (RanGAP) involved in mRNA processing and transport